MFDIPASHEQYHRDMSRLQRERLALVRQGAAEGTHDPSARSAAPHAPPLGLHIDTSSHPSPLPSLSHSVSPPSDWPGPSTGSDSHYTPVPSRHSIDGAMDAFQSNTDVGALSLDLFGSMSKPDALPSADWSFDGSYQYQPHLQPFSSDYPQSYDFSLPSWLPGANLHQQNVLSSSLPAPLPYQSIPTLPAAEAPYAYGNQASSAAGPGPFTTVSTRSSIDEHMSAVFSINPQQLVLEPTSATSSFSTESVFGGQALATASAAGGGAAPSTARSPSRSPSPPSRRPSSSSSSLGSPYETSKPRRYSDDLGMAHRYAHDASGASARGRGSVDDTVVVGAVKKGRRRKMFKPGEIAPEWESVTDPKERRKLQNRIAQRNFRKRTKSAATEAE